MEKRTLPVKLTEDEITQRGRAMAKFESDRAALEESKKASADEFKAKINTCIEAVGKLSRSINTGHEDREVECEWNMDFVRRVADLVRSDTGEVVETRPLSADEMQESLFPKKAIRPTEGKKLDMGDDAEGSNNPDAPSPNPADEGLGF